MTDTAGYFGLPKIEWGDNLEYTIYFDYPLYDWVTRSEALEGSQFLRIESGYEDSWIVNSSYVLEGNVRYIVQDVWDEKWDYDWMPFLQWARQKKQFRYYSNYLASSSYINSYLVEPITEIPSIEADGTRTIRLVIRNSSTPYDIAISTTSSLVTQLPSGSVLLLDNSLESYPGSGSIWYDISGNNIDFTINNSPTFSRTTGFDLDGTTQFFSASASSSFGSYWSSSTNLGGSLTVVMAVTPDVFKNAGLFMPWGYPGVPVGIQAANEPRRYKFALDQNSNGTLEVTTLTGPTSQSYCGIIGTLGALSASYENIILWEVTDTKFNVYRSTANANNSLSTILLDSRTGIENFTTWYDADPAITIGNQLANTGLVVSGSYFDGKIRAVAVYNRVLNAGEKTRIYNYLQSLTV